MSALPLPFRMLLIRCMTLPEAEAVEDCCCSCLAPLAAPPGDVSGMEGRDW